MIEKVARQCILARKDYIPGKPIEEVQQELGITDIIKMASNENPLGASPKAIEAMIQEVRTNAFRYPVSLCTAMGEKLAAYLGVKPSQLYIDNGGDAVITMLGLTFLNPEDEVVTAELTFPAYENITTKMGSKLIKVPMTAQGGYDLQGIAAAITPRTKLVFLCNPNNPTGRFIPRDELLAFLEKLPDALADGGRAAILTFHSGEDRLVKKSFRDLHRAGVYSAVSTEVIRPSAEECARNSRAKSTKMRWAIK